MERQITRGTKIFLQPTQNAGELTNPLFAINWFNTRSLWLYNFYNLIASRSLFKVGGKVLFKGRVIETLLGSPSDAREILLVVNYPSGERFLDLLSNRFFQVTSLLRLAAVRDFSFVLNRRVVGPELLKSRSQKFDASHAWAIHLYSSDRDIQEEVQFLRSCVAKDELTLVFASVRAGIVHTEDNTGNRKSLEYVTDRVVILEAENQEVIRKVFSGNYQEFTSSVSDSYLGILRRMM